MIRVRVELDKWGLGSDVKTLGTLLIANDGSGDAEHGNYEFRLAMDLESWQGGLVKNFNRNHSPFELIYRCLSVVYSREARLLDLLYRVSKGQITAGLLEQIDEELLKE